MVVTRVSRGVEIHQQGPRLLLQHLVEVPVRSLGQKLTRALATSSRLPPLCCWP